MSRLKYEVVASNGSYTNKNGEEKKRYTKCGVVFENDKGQLSIKMDSIPCGPEWSGWFNLFEPKPYDNKPMDSHHQAKANGYQRQPDKEKTMPRTVEVDPETGDESIPF